MKKRKHADKNANIVVKNTAHNNVGTKSDKKAKKKSIFKRPLIRKKKESPAVEIGKEIVRAIDTGSKELINVLVNENEKFRAERKKEEDYQLRKQIADIAEYVRDQK